MPLPTWLFSSCLELCDNLIPLALLSLRAGGFKTGVNFGHDPQGKTLGILGMGRIGHAIKAHCDPFSLKTGYHNHNPLSGEQAEGTEYVSFHRPIEESDIISINVL